MAAPAQRGLAVVLALGGITGIGITLSLVAKLTQQSALVTALILGLLLLFVWATWTGWQLWQGRTYGHRWAPIAFATQIPVLAVPGLSYQWFTGLYLGSIWHMGTGFPALTFTANIGATANVFVGQGLSTFWIGINWFAVLALVLLLRAKKAAAATAAQPADAAV